MYNIYIFSHPDYTVGFGISPNQPIRLADFTAGGELHPALKTTFFICLLTLYYGLSFVSMLF